MVFRTKAYLPTDDVKKAGMSVVHLGPDGNSAPGFRLSISRPGTLRRPPVRPVAAPVRGGAGGLFILGLGLELVEIGQNVDGKADRWAELVYRVKPLRVPRPARLPNPQTKPERRPPLIDVKVEDKLQRNGACFAADTPIRTPGGWAKVQDLKAGDRVLARSEVDAEGPVEAKEVLDAFATTARVWHLHAGGRVIATTAEHPFWVRGRGWAAAWEVRPGDSLAGHDGAWVIVSAVIDTGEHARVYNVRVADHQTYFVGCEEWDFSVWAHNACVVKSGLGHAWHLDPVDVTNTLTLRACALYPAEIP